MLLYEASCLSVLADLHFRLAQPSAQAISTWHPWPIYSDQARDKEAIALGRSAQDLERARARQSNKDETNSSVLRGIKRVHRLVEEFFPAYPR